MRPPMLAGPMERASSPPKVFESISTTSAPRAATAPAARPAAARQRIDLKVRCIHVSLRKEKEGFRGCSRRGSPGGLPSSEIGGRRCLRLGGSRSLVLLLLGRLGGRHGEARGLEAWIDLELGDGDRHPRRRTLGLLLDREGEDQALHGLE